MHHRVMCVFTDCMFMQVRMKSYASRAQLAVTQAEIDAATELEWDRRLITVLGSANNRLYEFRLQTANATYEANKVRHVTEGFALLSCICCKDRTHLTMLGAGSVAGNGEIFYLLYS